MPAILQSQLIILVFICLGTPGPISCQQPTDPAVSIPLTGQTSIHLVPRSVAGDKVITDEMSGFFDRIKPLDICIQLQIDECPTDAADSLRNVYKQFITNDVLDFTDSEKRFLAGVIKSTGKLLDTIPAALLPNDIFLIKTAGKYYGPSVFYTRDNAIVIPQPILNQRNARGMQRVLLHEIFHIISRYNEPLREAAYALIGFHRPNQEIFIPATLKERLLLNPDGLDTNWQIDLDTTEGLAMHMPFVYSPVNDFDPEAPNFFFYLAFNLIPVHNDTLVVNEQGLPGTDKSNDPVFLETITDNTGYIIHPDELMADNFVFLLKGMDDPDSLERLSPAGKALLKKFQEVIMQFE